MAWNPVDAAGVRDIIVFDGDCVLCSGHARKIDRMDKDRRFAFASMQDAVGRALAERFGVSPEHPETYIVVLDGRATFKSDAVLALARALPGWSWVRLGVLAPRPLRNWAYDVVARHRYRWFGRKKACLLADPALKARMAADAGSPEVVTAEAPR